mgnify:CR=1 FL=1
MKNYLENKKREWKRQYIFFPFGIFQRERKKEDEQDYDLNIRCSNVQRGPTENRREQKHILENKHFHSNPE